MPSEEAKQLAFELAQRWIRSNWLAYTKHQAMFEKVSPRCTRLPAFTLYSRDRQLRLSLSQYDVRKEGQPGAGGEYQVQVRALSHLCWIILVWLGDCVCLLLGPLWW